MIRTIEAFFVSLCVLLLSTICFSQGGAATGDPARLGQAILLGTSSPMRP